MNTSATRGNRKLLDAIVALAHLLRVLHSPEGARRRTPLGPVWAVSAIVASGLSTAVTLAVVVGNVRV